jgi:hypothetical protein
MIKSIILDQMPAGSLAIYEVSPQQNTHFVVRGNVWDQASNRPNRIILQTEIDTTLEEFEPLLRRWVAEAQHLLDVRIYENDGTRPTGGTLIFTLQGLAENADETNFGQYLLAGLGYLPTTLEGAFELNDEDPADLILMMCRQQAHPVVREALARQQRVRDEFRGRQRAELEVLRLEQAEFDARALKLLLTFLSPDQQAELRASRHFHVRAKNGALFRIDAKPHQNIFMIENGKEVTQYCVVSKSSIPVYDLMLAQKLMLESNFEEFTRLANSWDVRQGRHRNWMAEVMNEIRTIEDNRVFSLMEAG